MEGILEVYQRSYDPLRPVVCIDETSKQLIKEERIPCEPGNPEKNRTWIPLRYVYDALKLVSPYQYLAVAFYAEEANGWKWNGLDDNWNGRF